MAFSTDYSEVNSFDLIPKGEYEVIIKSITEHTTPKGATGLNLSLVVRNDVEQKYKNRCIFHTLWKRREPTQADMQVQGYSFGQIMTLSKSAKLPSGKSYETVLDLCNDLVNRPIRITVGHREYNGKTYEDVKYMAESKLPDCKHVFKENQAVSSDTVAPPKNDGFASAQTVDGYEEILSDDVVPF